MRRAAEYHPTNRLGAVAETTRPPAPDQRPGSRAASGDARSIPAAPSSQCRHRTCVPLVRAHDSPHALLCAATPDTVKRETCPPASRVQMPRFHHASSTTSLPPTTTTPHRPPPPTVTSIFDFAESFFAEHDLAPPSCGTRPPDDAMECSQPVDRPPAASQSSGGASQSAPTAPVYTELWGRLKWLSVINEKTLEGMVCPRGSNRGS